ncbi:iron-containing alcohol dehydrogenase [Syntrophomonas palmitatica]|uniref:iron-containing alcohol dehydrogenase n=1 Tax=Syntrophomonas palmitatica TaxID=402877 RepID=UPI0006D03F38|nr:iron-containing alcohol dehydrogenase [Syntrophomonas palmitatica]
MTPKYFMWDFHTLVECGSGCRTFVAQRFMEMGCKRVGMITDKGLVEAGIVELVKGIFDVQGGTRLVGIYDEIQPDAAMGNINHCAAWCREKAIDGMLTVGGGSVMDAAKGVKAMLGMGVTDIREIMPGNIGPYLRPLGKPLGIPHISIPTTAGTGSEVSPIAVIYNEEQKVKGDMLHPYIVPDYALLDPDLTVGLPASITADTGFDALSHAIEGYTSPGANPMIDALALQAMRLIKRYLPRAVENGKDLEARTNMLIASNISIMSFAMSGFIYPIHNVAHAVGGQFRISHGNANAVLVPVLMENLPQYYLPKIHDMAHAFGLSTAGKNNEEILQETINDIKSLQKACGVAPKFTLHLGETEMEQLKWAIKLDPAGIAFPLPDDCIKKCLDCSFDCK